MKTSNIVFENRYFYGTDIGLSFSNFGPIMAVNIPFSVREVFKYHEVKNNEEHEITQ